MLYQSDEFQSHSPEQSSIMLRKKEQKNFVQENKLRLNVKKSQNTVLIPQFDFQKHKNKNKSFLANRQLRINRVLQGKGNEYGQNQTTIKHDTSVKNSMTKIREASSLQPKRSNNSMAAGEKISNYKTDFSASVSDNTGANVSAHRKKGTIPQRKIVSHGIPKKVKASSYENYTPRTAFKNQK